MTIRKKVCLIFLLGIVIFITRLPHLKESHIIYSDNSATVYQVVLPETKHDKSNGTNQTFKLYLPANKPLPGVYERKFL